jgi:ABC-2 type transport system permease protein
MFLVTSITMLRERTTGTLERLMTLSIAKLDLLAGYGIAFGLLAGAQAVAVCLVGFLVLGLDAPRGAFVIGVLAVANALLGMALGLFARTESRRCSSCPPSSFPSFCCAACSSRATRWPASSKQLRGPSR